MRFKKALLIGVGSILMFTMGGVGPANADNGPHSSHAVANGGSALVSVAGGGCASCHRAHTAKAENLLKDTQPALCYTCHGGSAATLDVIDGTDNFAALPLRGGGFEYTLMNGSGATKSYSLTGTKTVTAPYTSTPQIVTSRHQIDGTTTGTMWGNGAISASVDPGKTGVTLECGSCHDPHGNGNYRILKPIPNDAGTQAADILTPAVIADPTANPPVVGVPAVLRPAAGINIPDAVAKNYTTVDYWLVADRQVPTTKGSTTLPVAGETDGYIANVSAWCTTCHTRYYANSGSAGVSSGDALFTYRHASARSDKEGLSRPNCIQCHVAHGTSAVMNGYTAPFVNAPDGAIPTAKGGVATPYIDHDKVAQAGLSGTPVGTSRLLRVDNRGTCVMCHNK